MKRSTNRWLILAAAAIVNFVHGNPYIWTVFQPYVKEEYGLSTAASSLPFSQGTRYRVTSTTAAAIQISNTISII